MSSAPYPLLRVAKFVRRTGENFVAVYEQPMVVRITHWLSAVAIFILIGSGIQIFFAFPSFGPKIPQHNLMRFSNAFDPTLIGTYFQKIALGQWLAGAEWWHFTFMWIFIACGAVYVLYEAISGHWRTVLFMPRDIPGVWPMARHYFLFGKKPEQKEQYNPLQKLAYTTAIFLGAVSMLSGLVIWNPVQLSWIGWIVGGFHYARIVHFAAMCGFLAFIAGHLIMVVLHGWRNFESMWTGWMEKPEYLERDEAPETRD